MAYPVIKFNTSTGSDTLSSGAGPDDAINGSGASLNASTTVDLSADSPDLSSIATDGSVVLWVETTSGRQFGEITAVDNSLKTVTVHAAYSVTEIGKNWAIGGVRATIDSSSSRNVFTDITSYWVIELETNQTITSKITIGNASILIRGAASVDRPSILASGFSDNAFIHSNTVYLRNLTLLHDGSDDMFESGSTVASIDIVECDIGSSDLVNCPVYLSNRHNSGYAYVRASRCNFYKSGLVSGAWFDTYVVDCFFKNNTVSIIYSKFKNVNPVALVFINNIVSGATNYVFLQQENNGARMLMKNNIFYNCSSKVTQLQPKMLLYDVSFNQFVNCGTAIGFTSTPVGQHEDFFADNIVYVEYNNYYNNTTNKQYGSLNSTETEVDPLFANPDNDNFYIRNDNVRNIFVNSHDSTNMAPFRQWTSANFERAGGSIPLSSYAKLTIKGN